MLVQGQLIVDPWLESYQQSIVVSLAFISFI